MNSKILFSVVLAVLLMSLFVLPLRALAAEPEVQPIEVRFDGGLVNKLYIVDGAGWITVDYSKFVVTTDTDIREGDGMLVPGTYVDLRAERMDGKLIATRITVLPENPGEVRFEGGKLKLLDLTSYTVKVNGTTFTTTADTLIEEGLMVGDFVEVRAERMDGKLIATEIKLL